MIENPSGIGYIVPVDELPRDKFPLTMAYLDIVRKYMAENGAKGGKKKTAAKRAAAKANGKKGGRPKGSKDSKPRKAGK